MTLALPSSCLSLSSIWDCRHEPTWTCFCTKIRMLVSSFQPCLFFFKHNSSDITIFGSHIKYNSTRPFPRWRTFRYPRAWRGQWAIAMPWCCDFLCLVPLQVTICGISKNQGLSGSLFLETIGKEVRFHTLVGGFRLFAFLNKSSNNFHDALQEEGSRISLWLFSMFPPLRLHFLWTIFQ
jgi:hypothetical protein